MRRKKKKTRVRAPLCVSEWVMAMHQAYFCFRFPLIVRVVFSAQIRKEIVWSNNIKLNKSNR